jgi:hypothetical protein
MAFPVSDIPLPHESIQGMGSRLFEEDDIKRPVVNRPADRGRNEGQPTSSVGFVTGRSAGRRERATLGIAPRHQSIWGGKLLLHIPGMLRRQS